MWLRYTTFGNSIQNSEICNHSPYAELFNQERKMKKPYEPVKRNIVAKGKATSVSIEKIYWDAIDQFANRMNKTPLFVLKMFIDKQPADHKDRAAWIRYSVVASYYGAHKRFEKAAVSESQ